MRRLLIAIALVGGLASVALCASYGWDQATVVKDQLTAAFIYGMGAVFSLVLHVLAIRVWTSGWQKCAGIIGIAGFLAFVMTAFTSLGGLASRADKVVSGRQEVLDTKADTKKQIDDLVAEKAGMAFKRGTRATVNAAELAVSAAKLAREQECGRVGDNCRRRQDAEAKAITALAEAQANKAATDRAIEIDGDLKRLRATKGTDAVGRADPLNALLATIFGTWADILTSWQKALFAVIYDTCLIALMIGIEILSYGSPPAPLRAASGTGPREAEAGPEPQVPSIPKATRPRLVSSNGTPVGSVKTVLVEVMERAPGSRIEIKDLGQAYREACNASGKRAASFEAFLREVEVFCKEIGIKRRSSGTKLYLLDVRLVKVGNAYAS